MHTAYHTHKLNHDTHNPTCTHTHTTNVHSPPVYRPCKCIYRQDNLSIFDNNRNEQVGLCIVTGGDVWEEISH